MEPTLREPDLVNHPARKQLCAPDTFRHAWFSARCSAHLGHDLYLKSAGVVGERVVAVTALVEGCERYRDWGDEVYVGMVSTLEFIRHVAAEKSREKVRYEEGGN